jgi:DNA polymerase-3 subunit alpha
VSIKEKASWEKELLGVSLSKQPFISHSKEPGIVLCGQIDEETVGQAVTVIGEVSMVTTSFTREHKTFATVSLEDISGHIEVMVWPRVYEKTTDLWQEGNILEVKGKVRLRDERVQFTCDDVRLYQSEPILGEESVAVREQTAIAVTPAAPIRIKRLVFINLNQTHDKENDLANFERLISIFKENPGQDDVNLRIINGTMITNLNLSSISVNYSLELHQRVVEVVGERGISVENINAEV